MGEFLRADDGIDGAGRQAFDAADAARFIDLRDEYGALNAIGWIKRQHFAAERLCELCDRDCAARRALIDLRIPACDCLRIRTTTGIAATRALRLRQQRIDFLSRHLTFMPGSAPTSGESKKIPGFSPDAASTMPSDIPNFILREARLATITVRRPMSAPGS